MKKDCRPLDLALVNDVTRGVETCPLKPGHHMVNAKCDRCVHTSFGKLQQISSKATHFNEPHLFSARPVVHWLMWTIHLSVMPKTSQHHADRSTGKRGKWRLHAQEHYTVFNCAALR